MEAGKNHETGCSLTEDLHYQQHHDLLRVPSSHQPDPPRALFNNHARKASMLET